jgi:hypothetical protein
MDEELIQEILDELFSSMEDLETRTQAILQFLEQKGLANQEELAPHLEQAANASNVRWRAARVRINHLVSGAIKSLERAAPDQTLAKDVKKPSEPPRDQAKETDSSADAKRSEEQKATDEQASPEPISAENPNRQKAADQETQAQKSGDKKSRNDAKPEENSKPGEGDVKTTSAVNDRSKKQENENKQAENAKPSRDSLAHAD